MEPEDPDQLWRDMLALKYRLDQLPPSRSLAIAKTHMQTAMLWLLADEALGGKPEPEAPKPLPAKEPESATA